MAAAGQIAFPSEPSPIQPRLRRSAGTRTTAGLTDLAGSGETHLTLREL